MSPNPIALTDDQLDIVRRAGSDATVTYSNEYHQVARPN
jgi:hypothetical protein